MKILLMMKMTMMKMTMMNDKDDMDADDEFEETIRNQGAHIAETPHVDMRTQLKVKQIKSIVDRYYELIKEKYNLDPEYIDYTNFELGYDHKTLFLKVGDKPPVLITAKIGDGFINLKTLERSIGVGGTRAIRDLLHLPEYTSKTKTLSAQAAAALRKVENNLPNIDNVEMTVLPNTVDTIVEEIERSFIYSGEDETGKKIYMAKGGRDETGTQTEWTKREIDGISKAMTTVKEELANNLAKLDETDKHLARENTKLEEAKAEQ